MNYKFDDFTHNAAPYIPLTTLRELLTYGPPANYLLIWGAHMNIPGKINLNVPFKSLSINDVFYRNKEAYDYRARLFIKSSKNSAISLAGMDVIIAENVLTSTPFSDTFVKALLNKTDKEGYAADQIYIYYDKVHIRYTVDPQVNSKLCTVWKDLNEQ